MHRKTRSTYDPIAGLDMLLSSEVVLPMRIDERKLYKPKCNCATQAAN